LQLDLLADAKCNEICRRSPCQENPWVVPAEGKTSLSAVSILLFIPALKLLSFRKILIRFGLTNFPLYVSLVI